MEFWKEGRTETGYGDKGLLLKDNEADHVVSLTKIEDGKIRILEECDGYFSIILTKEETIKALKEAIEWVSL